MEAKVKLTTKASVTTRATVSMVLRALAQLHGWDHISYHRQMYLYLQQRTFRVHEIEIHTNMSFDLGCYSCFQIPEVTRLPGPGIGPGFAMNYHRPNGSAFALAVTFPLSGNSRFQLLKILRSCIR